LQTLSDEELAAVLRRNADADASPMAAQIIRAVLDAGLPRQDNITVTILRPGGDWLLAPFEFAPVKVLPRGDDPANTTQRIVPRAPGS
jgi:hypothetical protein